MVEKQNTVVHVRLSHLLTKKLDFYCSKNHISYSKALRDAINAMIGTDSKWDILWKRLDKMTHAVNKASLKTYTIGEAFLYWTQYFFALTPDLNDDEKSQANQISKFRYERFMQALISRFQKAKAGKGDMLSEKLWSDEE